MRKVSEGRKLKYQFDSLSELSRYISDTPRKWQQNEAMNSTPSQQWDLGCGYAKAVQLARDGWLEGARDAEAALAQFQPKDPAPDTVTDFYGHMPHVARYCAGAPDSMIRHSPQATNGMGRVLTLYITVNANGSERAECMRNFGLGIAQYVNELETTRGVRCELHGTATTEMHGMRVTHTWKIKDADQPLDFAVLCFSVGHPAMLRRLEFALCERCDAREAFGYGMAGTSNMGDLIDPPSGAFVLNGMDRANTIAKTPADALTHIEKQITRMLDQPDAE